MSIKCPSNRGDKRDIVISVYRSPDMGGSLYAAVNGDHSPIFPPGGVAVPTVVRKTFVFR